MFFQQWPVGFLDRGHGLLSSEFSPMQNIMWGVLHVLNIHKPGSEPWCWGWCFSGGQLAPCHPKLAESSLAQTSQFSFPACQAGLGLLCVECQLLPLESVFGVACLLCGFGGRNPG